MGEGQEVNRRVAFADRHRLRVYAKRLKVHFMRKDNALTLPRRTTRVENIGNILLLGSLLTFFTFSVEAGVGHGKELVEVNRAHIVLRTHHLGVEDDNLLERGARVAQFHHRVVLLLFAHKDITHFCVINHIRHLCCAAGSEEGNRDGTNGVCPEVHKQAFGLVL